MAIKSKLNQELVDLMIALDEQNRSNQELFKAFKDQQRQVQVSLFLEKSLLFLKKEKACSYTFNLVCFLTTLD